MSITNEEEPDRPPQKESKNAFDLGVIAGGTGIVVGLGGLLMVMKAFVSAGFNGNIAAILLRGATPTDYLMFMGLLIIHTWPLFAVLGGSIYLPHLMSKKYILRFSRPLSLFHQKHGYGDFDKSKFVWALLAIAVGVIGLVQLYNTYESSVIRLFYVLFPTYLVIYVYIFHMYMESRKIRRIKMEHSLDIVPLLRTQKVKWVALKEKLEAENRQRLLRYMDLRIRAEKNVQQAVTERHDKVTKRMPGALAKTIVLTLSMVSVFATPGLWMPWEVITVRDGNQATVHVAQQVNSTGTDQTFYLPYESRIIRLDSWELKGREYCVPDTTYKNVDYGLQKCERPS